MNFKAYIARLRLLDARLVAATGAQLMWRIASKRGVELTEDGSRIVLSVGPKVIALALGSATGHGTREVSAAEFAELCRLLIEVDSGVTRNAELDRIADGTYAALISAQRIPPTYVTREVVLSAAVPTVLARLSTSQMRGRTSLLRDLTRAWVLFNWMDQRTSGDMTSRVERLFGMSPLSLWRCVYAAFGMAMAENAAFGTDGPTAQRIRDELGIDLDVVDVACSKLAVSTAGIRDWFTQFVLAQPEAHRPFVDDPLSDHGLVISDEGPPYSYLLPAPQLYMHAAMSRIFAELHSNFSAGRDREPDVNRLYGEALEAHVEQALRHRFGDRFSRVPTQPATKSADFVVKLDDITLVIELKKQLASRRARSSFGPDEVAQVFHEAYDAMCQLSSTARSMDGPVVAIVLVGEDLAVEAMPFFAFARSSGLSSELGLECVETIAWPDLESRLRKTSDKALSRTMIARQRERNSFGHMLNTAQWRRDRNRPKDLPEYLRAAHAEIMPLDD